MGDPAERRAAYTDLLALPDHLIGEILHGSLVAHPRPAVVHTRSASRLGTSLGGPFDLGQGGPGGWVILDEPELHLGGDVLVPDLAGWRRERMKELPEAPYLEVAPDWVCEVLSASTEAVDRTIKMPIYAREGVGDLWLLNPVSKTLETFHRTDEGWRASGVWSKNAKVRADPFAAVELDLAVLWER